MGEKLRSYLLQLVVAPFLVFLAVIQLAVAALSGTTYFFARSGWSTAVSLVDELTLFYCAIIQALAFKEGS